MAKVYSHLPASGVRCPYCGNSKKNTSAIWSEDGFERDAMTGYLEQKRGGYFVYTEDWICIKCEQVFDVKITIKAQNVTVKFQRVKS